MVGDLGEIIRNWENPLTLAQSKSYALQENRVLLKLLKCFIVIKNKPRTKAYAWSGLYSLAGDNSPRFEALKFINFAV